MQPRVSVIVPCWGVEKYLDRCVKSIVDQTLQDIEIILVDDESPDSVPEMCDEWAQRDNRIKVIHKKNGGLGYARNSGLAMATGEYVIFLDSDDWIEPQTYEVVYNKVKEKNLDICWFQRCWVDDLGNKIYGPENNEEYFIGEDQMKWFRKEIIGKDPCNPSSSKRNFSSCMALVRRTLYEDSDIRFPSEREIASEDFVFFIQFLQNVSSVGILPNVFYNYYVNPKSITNTYSEAKHDRLIKLMSFLYQFCRENYEWEEVKNNYYGHLFEIFKVILKFSSRNDKKLSEKLKLIDEECNHPLLSQFYLDSKNIKYSLADKLYIWMMKHQKGMFFVFLYNFIKK